ncbi:MAG TPA: hypothetical protein VG722_02100, partial [Tepidisphaeraceae bacterium]|nr:hypothetical protein [Tepidisphaeraceae bacterium]
ISLYDNPNEAVRLRIYDAHDQLLGEVSDSKSQPFLGLVSTTPFAYATVINLPPEDGVFAIDNLRFGIAAAPMPTAVYGGLWGFAVLALKRMKRFS